MTAIAHAAWGAPLDPAARTRLQDWRRALHAEPELSLCEHDTQSYLAAQLAGLGLQATALAQTGLVVRLGRGESGRVLLLRADMDALPIHEESSLAFASRRPGKMHACGHDAHMACLLAVAERLAALAPSIDGTVLLAFQPGEEEGQGAVRMIEAGLLDGRWCNDPALRVQAALGLHVWSRLPTAVVSACAGPVMATVDDFTITVHGRGGHGALPHQTRDAIVAAAAVVQALQTLPSRQVDPLEPLVVSVGSIQGGSAYNVIAEQVVLRGTVRSYGKQVAAHLPQALETTARGAAAALGCEATVDYRRYTIALHNDAAMVELVAAAASATASVRSVDRHLRMMAGEDFAFFADAVPACFFFVGCGGPEGDAEPHHSPRFVIDEAALATGAEVMLAAAERWFRLG
jgi:amidohydrolase